MLRSEPYLRVGLMSASDCAGLYWKSRQHNGSLKRASHSIRAGDPPKGDASACVNV